MEKFKNILNSFTLRNELNPKVWENPSDSSEAEMKPLVRKALMTIAEKFIEYLGDDVPVEDIILTGSLSNFNWSEYSDFDLHIIVDMKQYEKDSELKKEMFDLKKGIFNDKHDIKIYGYDVELYVQDIEEKHTASGMYSILNDEWVAEPKKTKDTIDKSLLGTKAKAWIEKIEKAIEKSEKEKNDEVLDKLKDKLKEYRKSGLDKEGELSYENLVFKVLRRLGKIENLFQAKNKIFDKKLSIERKINEIVDRNWKLLTEQNDVTETDSKFLNELDRLADNNAKFEYNPGQKIPYIPDVEKLQAGLQILGYSLPKWGIDGKFGPETENATKTFQGEKQLSSTGVFGVNEFRKMIEELLKINFKDEDLGKVEKVPYYLKYKFGGGSTDDIRGMIVLIIDLIEGGYYHPIMKERNPSKYAVMGKSGETMFGMDREHGRQEEMSSAGKEFWRLIDAEDAKNNWKHEYVLNDNPNLRNKLIDLSVDIQYPQFLDLSDRYLNDDAKALVMSDPKLKINFLYATYNGSGWFQKFARKFNQKVDEGVRDIKELQDYAIQIRNESGNSLIRRTGKKMEDVFNSMG